MPIQLTYKESKFYGNLEKIIAEYGFKFGKMVFYNKLEDLIYYETKTNTIKGISLAYSELIHDDITCIYKQITKTNPPCLKKTSEAVAIMLKGYSEDDFYQFDTKNNLLFQYNGPVLSNKINAKYKGILTEKYLIDKNNCHRAPRITKERFLQEIRAILSSN